MVFLLDLPLEFLSLHHGINVTPNGLSSGHRTVVLVFFLLFPLCRCLTTLLLQVAFLILPYGRVKDQSHHPVATLPSYFYLGISLPCHTRLCN